MLACEANKTFTPASMEMGRHILLTSTQKKNIWATHTNTFTQFDFRRQTFYCYDYYSYKYHNVTLRYNGLISSAITLNKKLVLHKRKKQWRKGGGAKGKTEKT